MSSDPRTRMDPPMPLIIVTTAALLWLLSAPAIPDVLKAITALSLITLLVVLLDRYLEGALR